jgi:antitoxin component of MazEF toxin-antitoxin module
MRYTKKVVKTSGGLVIRIPADIVKVMQLTEDDYLEVDIQKIDTSALRKAKK